MKLDVLLLISAFILAFVHPDAAQVAASTVLLLLTVRIERARKTGKRNAPRRVAGTRG